MVAALSDAERESVTAAVEAAESRTSAEIVTVAVRASGRYDRAEDLVGLLLGAVAAACAWAAFRTATPSDDWVPSESPWELPAILGALFVGFAVGTRLAARFDALRAPFVRPEAAKEETQARAAQAFFDRRVHGTRGGTGLLLFVSMFERRAVVLADEAVRAAIGQDGLDGIRDRLTAGLAAGTLADALVAAVGDAATRLAGPLPCGPGDADELPNEPARPA